MGKVDLDALFRIYKEINSIVKKHQLLFSFKIDHGTYETAIQFIDAKPHHPPISEDWSCKPIIFCPDLLDYHNKIIIEYEEEVGERMQGAYLAKKGHNREGDMDTKRDSRRNRYYKQGGFKVLRIWDSDKDWKKKLEDFLLKQIQHN